VRGRLGLTFRRAAEFRINHAAQQSQIESDRVRKRWNPEWKFEGRGNKYRYHPGREPGSVSRKYPVFLQMQNSPNEKEAQK
jgi:hypothetical protein